MDEILDQDEIMDPAGIPEFGITFPGFVGKASMIRTMAKSGGFHSFCTRRALSSTGPSEKTTILLKHLSPTITESVLKDALKDVKIRKVEMQPGFSMHVLNEAHASLCRDLIYKTGREAHISSTNMPALLLKNLPTGVSDSVLQSKFAKYDPKFVRFFGGPTLQVVLATAEDAAKTGSLVESLELDGRFLKSHTARLPDGRFAVSVHNIPPSIDVVNARERIMSQLSGIETVVVNASTDRLKPTKGIFRFASQTTSEVEEIVSKLNDIRLGGAALSASVVGPIDKPAIILRKVKHVGDDGIKRLLNAHKPSRVQLISRSSDVPAHMAVAYFDSEEAAFTALSKLHGVTVSGKKISASYREVSEPAIRISGIPSSSFSEAGLSRLLEVYRPCSIELMGDGEARVLLATPVDVELACNALGRKQLDGGGRLTVRADPLRDSGIEVQLPSGLTSPTQQLRDALSALGITPKGLKVDTNNSACIAFNDIAQATAAHADFVEGRVSLSSAGGGGEGTGEGGIVSSRLSTHPAFVLEVDGLDPETPAAEVTAALEATGLVSIARVERSAIVKFRRHLEIVPGLKQLKKIVVDGSALRPYKYRSEAHLRSSGAAVVVDEEYEGELEQDGAAQFDGFSLRTLLQDYMHTDPATRYQIARNVFERSLYDAKGVSDVSHLLGEYTTPAARDEAQKLLKQDSHVVTERLFQLFLQRDDMASFLMDFKDLSAFYGAADSPDPFAWSQFNVEVGEDVTRLHDELRKLEISEGLSKGKRTQPGLSGSDATLSGTEIVIPGEGEEDDKVISLEDPTRLTDKDGRIWSGAILNTDMTQKPMPGNRVGSFRTLVVVGNLRGSAGYGMGKGKTGPDATIAAFRDAIRNLVHIDLYDNFGLAHDCHGKHNSCHAYVRATPSSRLLVGSKFSAAVLTRFGISSASVKLVGRRDPYAMVKALFNAIQQHKNIDEIAKERGKRYLTLRWAYDNNV